MDKELLLKSVVGRDFLKYKKHPSIDKFLDYRLALMDMLELPIEDKKYPDEWLKTEIKAVDEILRIKTTK